MTPYRTRTELANALTTQSNGAFLIRGPTLIGKSWLIKELCDYLTKYDKRGAHVHHFSCSSGHTGYEPVLDAIDFLAKRKNWSTKKQAIFFGIKYSGKIVGALGGVARRMFPDAISKEALEELKKSLDEFSKQQTEKVATLNFPRSESSKIGQFLDEVIKKSGRPLIMLIDRLEELPTPGIKLLQMLVDTKPPGVLLVVSISSESGAFLARPDIRELVNSFKRIGGCEYPLTGYSADELRSMRNLIGFPTTAEAAEKAFDYSLDGRIGLVKDWLRSPDENNDILQPAANQLVAHYAIQYGRLSEPEKALVKCLGAVYPRGVDVLVAKACLACTTVEVESKMQGVLGSFAALSNRAIVLSNAHVLHFLATDVGSLLVHAAYTDVATRVLSPAEAGSVQQANMSLIPLSVQAMNAETLVREVREDLLRGAHESALSRLRAWRGWKQQASTPDEEADLMLLEADALGQTGDYREAIEVLNRVPAGSMRDVEVAVSIGEKYWRTGEQNIALRRYAEARRKAKAAGRQDVWLKAATRTVAVKNEMREGAPSARLASKLAQYCEALPAAIPDRDQCLVYRTVARTLALAPSQTVDAERYARLALDIALNRTKSSRDEGNARYALGDVLRHSERFDEATFEFEAAIGIAERTGNFDLRLYSHLALAACAISGGDLQRLDSRLRDLKEICSDPESPESKILGLFLLAGKRLRGDQVPFVDPASSLSGRPWTTRLLKLLASQAGTTQAIRGATIVL